MGVVLPPRTFAGCFGPIFSARFGWFGFGWFGLDGLRVYGGVSWVYGFRIHLSSLPSTLLQVSLSYFNIVSSDKSNWGSVVNWMLLRLPSDQDSLLTWFWVLSRIFTEF